MGWLICRLFHKGFRFWRVGIAASGARTVYVKCTKCGRYDSAPISRDTP